MESARTIKMVHTRDTLNLADRIGMASGGVVIITTGTPRISVMAVKTRRTACISRIGNETSVGRSGEIEGTELRMRSFVVFWGWSVEETAIAVETAVPFSGS